MLRIKMPNITHHTLWLWASHTYASLTHQLQVDWSRVNTFDAFSEENKAPLLLPQFILQVSTAKLLRSACSRWWRCSPPLPPCSMLSGMCGVSLEARNIASQHWITGGGVTLRYVCTLLWWCSNKLDSMFTCNISSAHCTRSTTKHHGFRCLLAALGVLVGLLGPS